MLDKFFCPLILRLDKMSLATLRVGIPVLLSCWLILFVPSLAVDNTHHVFEGLQLLDQYFSCQGDSLAFVGLGTSDRVVHNVVSGKDLVVGLDSSLPQLETTLFGRVFWIRV